MQKCFYLGIDQGTTGTTSALFDADWTLCATGYAEHTQHYPREGWVEHDPNDIWGKLQESVAQALRRAGVEARHIRAIGLANQGETCLAWDKATGKPIGNAIVWQDRRTAGQADELRECHGDMIREKTGVQVDAYFSALKLRWILDNVPGARRRAEQGHLQLGTMDAWLMWKMTAGAVFATDPSTASRTMLWNLSNREWDDEILALLGLPKSLLPQIVPSAAVYGTTAREVFFDAEIPIAGSVVDQAAALFGQACCHPGAVKTTYGTGCFMLANTGPTPVRSQHGLVTTVAWDLGGETVYALDGGVYTTGAAVQWLRDGLGIIDTAAQTETLARSVADSGGVYFVPAFVGLAAPHWDQYARGTIVGITAGTRRAHLVRATLEAIAFQVAENLDAMRRDTGLPIDAMRVDGGAVGNGFLMQFQADVMGIPVEVPEIHEMTALGAAQLAAVGIGDVGRPEEMAGQWRLSKRYEPAISADERQTLCARWQQAVERSRRWAEPD
jgi:glycerol kinase